MLLNEGGNMASSADSHLKQQGFKLHLHSGWDLDVLPALQTIRVNWLKY